MKYLATFVIGVGLMANGPAVSDTLLFPNLDAAYSAEISRCLTAQETGHELRSDFTFGKEVLPPAKELREHWFLSKQNDVYVVNYLVAILKEDDEWIITCFETAPK